MLECGCTDMTIRLNLPTGTSDFKAIRESSCYYVDKTRIISGIIRQGVNNCLLFTRPRRFGKSTTMSMLRHFFDIGEDSSALFKGLEVMGDGLAVEQWMNRYPVIAISFKDVDGPTYEDAIRSLAKTIVKTYSAYPFLKGEEEDPWVRKALDRYFANDMDSEDMKDSISLLARLLYRHYGRKVIVLVDEYDVPLSKADEGRYYDQMLGMVRAMLSRVLKDNECVAKAVMTGCLRISKESIFTGLNNLDVYSLTCDEYADCFGFTESEVAGLLRDADLSDRADVFRRWYDGYRIGRESIYCPWDVLKYVGQLQADPSRVPMNYWANSSGNSEVYRFLAARRANIGEDYETLINGGTIEKVLSEELTYADLYDSDDNLWSLLFETGYLTLAGSYDSTRATALRLPNNEMCELFKKVVKDWFTRFTRSDEGRINTLYDALWSGDEKAASSLLSDYLVQTISYNDYGEDYYHAFLAGLLSAGGRYSVLSNPEAGEGRADLIVKDIDGFRALVFEFKRSKSEDGMEMDCRKALDQIAMRRYAVSLQGFHQVRAYGVSFYLKRAAVRSKVLV